MEQEELARAIVFFLKDTSERLSAFADVAQSEGMRANLRELSQRLGAQASALDATDDDDASS